MAYKRGCTGQCNYKPFCIVNNSIDFSRFIRFVSPLARLPVHNKQTGLPP